MSKVSSLLILNTYSITFINSYDYYLYCLFVLIILVRSIAEISSKAD